MVDPNCISIRIACLPLFILSQEENGSETVIDLQVDLAKHVFFKHLELHLWPNKLSDHDALTLLL